MSDREHWLNGWTRDGNLVLIGTGVHCAGCGQDWGVTCVAFSEDWVSPDKDPDWPFNEDTCPVHEALEKIRDMENPNQYKVQIGADGMPIRSLKGRLPT